MCVEQFNVINHQCVIILYTTAICLVYLDCVLVSCPTYMYIMENTLKTRYDVTFSSFME